jgi:ATP phosphoribosyltransferase
VSMFIGLSKGELANGIRQFLSGYGIEPEMRKRVYTQRIGGNLYRILRSRDVPRFVGNDFDFGITGKDLCEDEMISGNKEFRYLRELDFGEGTLVFFGKGGRIPGKPRIVTSSYYPNLASRYASEVFNDFSLLVVDGATEGFVASDQADVGFDFTRTRSTIKQNGLSVIEEVLPTRAVLIGSAGKTQEDFPGIKAGGPV